MHLKNQIAQNEMFSALKRNEIIIQATTGMKLKGIYADWHKPDAKGQVMHDPTYMRLLKESNS